MQAPASENQSNAYAPGAAAVQAPDQAQKKTTPVAGLVATGAVKSGRKWALPMLPIQSPAG